MALGYEYKKACKLDDARAFGQRVLVSSPKLQRPMLSKLAQGSGGAKEQHHVEASADGDYYGACCFLQCGSELGAFPVWLCCGDSRMRQNAIRTHNHMLLTGCTLPNTKSPIFTIR